MQSLNDLKSKGQESWNRLVETGQQQPESVKLWAVTAASAVAGGLALTAVAKGVLGIVSVLTVPPVALAVGAVAGGAVGWTFMQDMPTTVATVSAVADSSADASVATV